MTRRIALMALGLLFSACNSEAGDGLVSDPAALCAAADDHLQECIGQSGIDLASCDAADAQAVLDSSCEELRGESADGFGSSFLCGFGLKCQCPPEQGVPDFQILDDEGDSFGCGGPCRSSPDGGFEGGGYHYGAPGHGVNASWRIPVASAGRYRIRAFIPAREGAGSATYVVNTCSAWTSIENVSQSRTAADWVELGEFDLEPGAEVRLGGVSGQSFLADALEVERIGPSSQE